MRTLDADVFGGSRRGLLLLAVGPVAWAWGLLAAGIPQYEASENALLNVDQDSRAPRAIADFPAQSARRIHPGQPAVLQASGTQQSIQAEVSRVAPEGPFVRVTFKLQQPSTNDQSQSTMRATASITVDHVSPATIVLLALGGDNR